MKRKAQFLLHHKTLYMLMNTLDYFIIILLIIIPQKIIYSFALTPNVVDQPRHFGKDNVTKRVLYESALLQNKLSC